MGDFNEVVGTSMSGFAKITSEFQLVDVIGHFHSVRNEVSTHARGPNRLDYVFCSQSLLPAVVACGAEPFNQHIFSDHRALFVDWDEVLLFSAQTP
jgi:endonuclease/exonuclease/phosphatase family metal-dependent hydrolase